MLKPERAKTYGDMRGRIESGLGISVRDRMVAQRTPPTMPTDFPRRLLTDDWTPRRKPAGLAELGPRSTWPGLLTTEQAAEYLQVGVTWLEQSAVPVVLLQTVGTSNRKMRRYRPEDLDNYIKEHLCLDRRIA